MAACSAVPVAILRDARPRGRAPQDEVVRVHSDGNRVPSGGGRRDCPYLMAMSGHDDHAASRERAFFGRRKGHRLRSRQVDLMATLLPRLALILGEPPPNKLAQMFSRPVEAVRLEIGFGGGENLITQACAHPAIGFIGCEPFVNGMAKILSSIEEGAIDNIRLYAGDSLELLALVPPPSLYHVELLYPHP